MLYPLQCKRGDVIGWAPPGGLARSPESDHTQAFTARPRKLSLLIHLAGYVDIHICALSEIADKMGVVRF
jgi:hypothetical protein